MVLASQLNTLSEEGAGDCAATAATSTTTQEASVDTVQQAIRDKISETLDKRQQTAIWLEENQLERRISETGEGLINFRQSLRLDKERV